MSTSLKPLGFAVVLALAGCSQGTAPVDSAAATAATDTDTMAEAPVAADAAAEPAPAADAVPAPQLQAAMRDLWHGHIVHARDYVLAVHAGNEVDAKAAADAVVENAKQISSAVAGFYGEAGGDQMMTLLAGHWGAVKAMTDARAAKDEAGASKAMDDLNANAAAIAKFLSGANPNLPEDAVLGLMLAHGAHHSAQINLILADDTAGEATEWAAMQSHMDMIADALAAAIAKQFPDKAS
ncbi:MAG: hypothetical protein L0H23_03340 [Luteimonas sp.]|nr:hypothetical protein [Luteimonas sp.]